MLIAVFNDTTGWAGKTVTYDDGVITLQGHGNISAVDLLDYDNHGYLTWAFGGLREWVEGLAAVPPAASPISPAHREVVADDFRSHDRHGHLVLATDTAGGSVRSQDAADNLTLVWLGAFGPLFVAALAAASTQMYALYGIPLVLLAFDWNRLKNAGIETKGLEVWLVLLHPAYLYLRLRRTGQPLWPLFMWVLCFFVGLLTLATT